MFNKNTRFKFFLIFLLSVFLITTGIGCKGTPKELKERIKPINLVYWRSMDGQDAFGGIINGFNELYPHISVTYKLIRPEEYEQKLLEAWAEDKGPDIFSIPTTWLGKYKSKIMPVGLSQGITMARQVIVGTIKKEAKIIEETKRVPNLRQLRETFVETVAQDIVIDNAIYGLPLSLDVLSLYYNRDLLNNAGIVSPPETWEEFINNVRDLVLQDRYGNFIQSGASIGTSNNINYASDILSLLMMQNGTPMAQDRSRATFNQTLPGDETYFPAQEALSFYTGFANPSTDVYTWNKDMPNELDAFIAGKLGFIFGYSDYLTLIKQQGPKLNFDIAKSPQISGTLKEVNHARYFIEVVSKKTKHPSETWAFILYATESQNAKTFLERAKHPTAHRELIEWQLQDFDFAPFANSVLTAQTWYKGKNYSLVKETFKEMIKDVLNGVKQIPEAIDYAAGKVNLTY